MKKIGFTLAEVLVTLSIIGVVAALTLPGLVTSHRNQVNATRLASTVGILENAFSNMLVQEGVDSLFETQAWRNAVNANVETGQRLFAGNLGRYLKHNGFRTSDEVRNAYENNITGIGAQGNHASCWRSGNLTCGSAKTSNQFISLKNGALVAIHTLASNNDEEDRIRAAGGRLVNEAADVMIDVNGPEEGPNIWGRDNFNFYLGHDGVLYAAGSREVYIYEGLALDADWNGDACDTTNANAIGYICTNRLIENGYRVDY